MKIKSFFKKYTALILLAIFVVFCLLIVLPNLSSRGDIGSEKQSSYNGLLEVWHIENFEGGTSSRSGYIRRRAMEYEKMHTGTLVQVSTYTYEQVIDKLNNGAKFDLISFSCGESLSVLPYLTEYTGSLYNCMDAYVSAGEIEKKQYAVPYMTGVYGLFARTNNLVKLQVENLYEQLDKCAYTKTIGKNKFDMATVQAGFGAYNSPFSALNSTLIHNTLNIDTTVTQYQAYQKFVADKTATVYLGTQRDIYRLGNRVQNGKMEDITFCPLDTFSDLTQFMAIGTKDDSKYNACVQFIEYLIGDKAQSKLTEVGMFPTTYNNIYTAEWYQNGFTAVSNTTNVVNCFSSMEQLTNIKQTANNKYNLGA